MTESVAVAEVHQIYLLLLARAADARRAAAGTSGQQAAALRGKATGYRLAADQLDSLLNRAAQGANP